MQFSKILIVIVISILFIAGCSQQVQNKNNSQTNQNIKEETIDRESKIPSDVIKVIPKTDINPPKSHSNEYEDPVPLSNVINTAGAEDSAFIMPDGKELYFFFTPDVRIPVEKQIIDGVTGIYVAKKINNAWMKPERIILQDKGRISGDGCEFVQNNIMWFCSVREGYTGVHWFTAEYKDNKWKNWENADFNLNYKVGELHFTKNWNEVYFHSDRDSGKGELDIWTSKKVNGEWQEPINLEEVNSETNEGWPALSPDETELWISKNYGLWKSKKTNDKWSTPELIISPLAGEATIDNEGNVYFTHHFYKNNKMIEADIYVAKKK
jgi:hypothetical protein